MRLVHAGGEEEAAPAPGETSSRTPSASGALIGHDKVVNHNTIVYQYRSGYTMSLYLYCTGALYTFSHTVWTNQRAPGVAEEP